MPHPASLDEQLAPSLPAVIPAGGWSLLLDVAQLGLDSFTASQRLLEQGRIAVTPMRDWGAENGDRYVRLVFSNEPLARLRGLGERVRRALTGFSWCRRARDRECDREAFFQQLGSRP